MNPELQKVIETIEKMGGHVATMAEKVTKLEDAEKKRLEAEAAAKEKKTPPTTRDVGVPGSDLKNDGREFSFARAAVGIMYGNWKGAEFERECFQHTDETAYGIPRSEREMAAGNDQLGGYLVPNQVLSNFFIDLLRPNIVVEAMGATMMDNLTASPIEVPRQVGGATAYWTGENQAITPSDLTLGNITMQPRQISALVKMSNRLDRMSIPAAEPLIRRDMGSAIAEKIDLSALRGTGANGEPIGIANTVGINVVALGTNGGVFDFEAADLMRQALAVKNALKGRLGYTMNPTVSGKMRRERIAQYTGQTKGAYVVLPMSDAELGDRLGFNWKETTQIPTNLSKGTGSNLSEITFANWQELMIAMWMGLELDASRQAGDAFVKSQVWLKASIEVDVALRHVESFCLVSDALTI